MRLTFPKLNIRIKSDPDHATGLLLSFLSASMKANKSNNPAPISHLMRERLSKRGDRRLLNVLLNGLASTYSKKDDKNRPMLKEGVSEDAGDMPNPDESSLLPLLAANQISEQLCDAASASADSVKTPAVREYLQSVADGQQRITGLISQYLNSLPKG